MAEENEVKLGCRIICGQDDRATILYVGPVDGYSGQWFGVNWDDDGRGKHDGSVGEHRYFQASSSTSGSFVRLKKVRFGCDLLTSVYERYGAGVQEIEELDDFNIGSKQVEFVGMEKVFGKQNIYKKLRTVVLEDMEVSSCGCVENVNQQLTGCVELDLRRNLISDWQEIVTMTRALPHLKIINLSKNRMNPETCVPSIFFEDCRKLNVLVLNESFMEWEHVMRLSLIFDKLQGLGLCRNLISNCTLDPSMLENLTWLDLESNNLTEWSNVADLEKLQKLEILNLSRNGLSNIEIKNTSSFPSLKVLYLSYNNISEWTSIDCLNRLQKLEHLFVHRNPLFEKLKSETARQMVLARVSDLVALDRQMVENQERRGAELDYLKTYVRQWLEAQKDEAQLAAFAEEHPRYLKLIKIYGSPDLEEVSERPDGVLKHRLVTVKLTGVGMNKIVDKSLPEMMTVQKLKALVARLCRKNPRSVELHCDSLRTPGFSLHLENDLRDLRFYSVEDGDTIRLVQI